MNLNQKVSLSLSAIVILTMTLTAAIVAILVTHQNQSASYDQITNSFNVVEALIRDEKENLLLDTSQLATGANMGEKIRFLSENREILGYLTVREMYEKIADALFNLGMSSGVWQAEVYDVNSKLIGFALFDPDIMKVGYVHMQSGILCRIARIKRGEKKDFNPNDFSTVDTLPQHIPPRFPGLISTGRHVRFEVVDNALCLAAYAPISAKTYDPVSETFVPKIWGVVKTIKKFDDDFIQKTANLTGSGLNVFIQKAFSIGNMTAYTDLNLETLAQTVKTRGNKRILLNEVEVDKKGYFQGVMPITTSQEHLASIAVLQSTEKARQNARQVIRTLLLVTVAVILFLLPVSLSLVRRFFIRPLLQLNDITSKIAQGDLERRISVGKSDELGTLAASFSTMQTSIKKRLSALEKAEEKYRNLFEFAPDGICITTPSGKVLSFNNAFFRMSEEKEKNRIYQSNVTDYYAHPENRDRMLKNLSRKRIIRNFNLEFKSASGRQWPAHVSLQVIRYEGEDAILAIIRDMTRQKEDQAQLFYLRNLLSNIIDSMPSVIVGFDQNFNIILWNEKARDMFGIEEKDAVGKLVQDLYPFLSDKMERVKNALNAGKPYVESKIYQQIKKDLRYFNMTIYPLTGPGQSGGVLRIDEITEQVRLEEMVVQSEKMVSLGGLAAGMAHEINNPLAGVLQNAFVLNHRLTGDLPPNHKAAEECNFSIEQLRKYIDKRELQSIMDNITSSGKRAAQIVKNMLSFARMEKSKFSEYPIDELLDSTVELAKSDYDLKKNYDFKLVQIEREYDDNLPMVRCSKSKIQQAFFNILQNGAQAMATQGTYDGKPPRFRLKIEKLASDVLISIKDNGPGMEEVACKRVFEPFFTTKPVGTGTGLGMSVTYFIIAENHKGTLSVRTLPLQGAEFIITLPIEGP